jgi:F-type H+/Na+-transporting ATPase subunit alpha
VLPAVDVGKSVSRVGGKAQWAAFRAVTGDLKLAYAQFEERETFSRFGAQLDADARAIIEHGKHIRACLGQSESSPVSVAAQIMILLALSERLFDKVPIERMGDAQQALEDAAGTLPEDVSARFECAEKFSDEDRATIMKVAREALAAFVAVPADTDQVLESGDPPATAAAVPPSELRSKTDDSTAAAVPDMNADSHAEPKRSDPSKRRSP